MIDPQTLFNEITSPFLFMPLLETTFLGGSHSERGADFLSILFWNLYIAQPHEAILDVTERNFGFQITSIAGVNVEDTAKQSTDETEEKKVDGGEVGAMKQEEVMRQNTVAGKKKIFDKQDLQVLIAQQISMFVAKFEGLLSKPETKTCVRMRLYQLIATFIELDDAVISTAFSELSGLLQYIIQDYDRYERNSTMLLMLNRVLKAITW